MLLMAFPKPDTPVPIFFIAILAVVTEIEWMGGRGGCEELVPFFRPHLALHFPDIGGISWDRHLPMLLMAFPKPDTAVHIFSSQCSELLQRSSGWAGAPFLRPHLSLYFSDIGGI